MVEWLQLLLKLFHREDHFQLCCKPVMDFQLVSRLREITMQIFPYPHRPQPAFYIKYLLCIFQRRYRQNLCVPPLQKGHQQHAPNALRHFGLKRAAIDRIRFAKRFQINRLVSVFFS